MKGSLSHDFCVGVPAEKLWACYGTLGLANLVSELLPGLLEKIDILEGDGGAGTLLELVYAPDASGSKLTYKEKFITVDNEKRMKQAVIVEGGFLDMGFCYYGVRFEIEAKDNGSSIIKSTIDYEVDDEHVSNASLVSIQPLINIAQVVGKHLESKI